MAEKNRPARKLKTSGKQPHFIILDEAAQLDLLHWEAAQNISKRNDQRAVDLESRLRHARAH